MEENLEAWRHFFGTLVVMSNENEKKSTDPYARSEYRRLIAWKPRIERESPFLLSLLGKAPVSSVVDIGCGSGEHVAFLSEMCERAVGVDRSDDMMRQAKTHEEEGRGRFFQADATELTTALKKEAPFGLALCLGNMLPHVLEDSTLERILTEMKAILAPEGIILLQILNYQKILEKNERALPVNLRPGDGSEEIVFLRLMKPGEDGRILFFPVTLLLHPDKEDPISLKTSRRVELRAWQEKDLVPRFEAAGFDVELRGNMEGAPWIPGESSDLVVIAKLAVQP